MKKDWFRPKSYTHIGLPIRHKDRKWVYKYVSNPESVATHAFIPFIYRKVKQRKFRRTLSFKGERTTYRKLDFKSRDLFYASHLDSQIYSYYSYLLNNCYEKLLKIKNLDHVVTAYRSIPANEPIYDEKGNKTNSKRNKNNIDHAKEVFDFIREAPWEKTIALTLDIKSFFDELDHKKLKSMWSRVLGRNDLPNDHYNIYKNLSNYSFINENQLFNLFKDEIICGVPENSPKKGSWEKRKVKRRKFLYEKGAKAYCLKEDIKKVKEAGLIHKAKYELNDNGKIKYESGKPKLRKKGIPQGTPLSATLANIYLIDFDAIMSEQVSLAGGMYRRYSDDIIIVCSKQDGDYLRDLALNKIGHQKLTIQNDKTRRFLFTKDNNDNTKCYEYLNKTKGWCSNYNLEYLGFTFDGKRARIKSASIAKYYRKMKRKVRRGGYFAKYGSNKDPFIYRRKLFQKFTHVGAKRRKIYQRDSNDPSKFHITKKQDWGNYLSYVYLAAKIFKDPNIKKQLKNHVKILKSEIFKSEP